MPNLSNNLPALAVLGNQIVAAQSLTPVILRGINWSGLEYTPPEMWLSPQKRAMLEADLAEMIDQWRANIVRLPFNQDWALTRPEYLTTLDWVIELASQQGAYTLLDLQWLDAVTPRGHNNDGSTNFVAPLPNLTSITLWKQLASRYRGEPAVLYDIFNEPHDKLAGDETALSGITIDAETFPISGSAVTMDIWQPWAIVLIAAIREQNPEALIFVPGLDWAFNLRGFPLPGIEGIVYSSHVYRNKGNDWDGAFGRLAESAPVFIGEWGGTELDLEWGRSLARYMADRNLGWTAWSWTDYPPLGSRDESGEYQPTAFGSLVRSALPMAAFARR